VKWDEAMGKLQTEDTWSFFRQLMDSLAQKYVPVRKIVKASKRKPMWLTHNAIKIKSSGSLRREIIQLASRRRRWL